MAKRKRNNPGNPGFVTTASCNQRYGELNTKMDEVLQTLRGDPAKFDDAGLVGEIRDMRRDRKWVYAMITLIGIPTVFLIFKFVTGGG